MKLPLRLALEAFSMHLEFRHILDHQSKDVSVKEFRVCNKVTFSDFLAVPVPIMQFMQIELNVKDSNL